MNTKGVINLVEAGYYYDNAACETFAFRKYEAAKSKKDELKITSDYDWVDIAQYEVEDEKA